MVQLLAPGGLAGATCAMERRATRSAISCLARRRMGRDNAGAAFSIYPHVVLTALTLSSVRRLLSANIMSTWRRTVT